MLKKSANCVLASFRPSTLRVISRISEGLEGVFPFAKIYYKGERPARSAVCTSSGPHSLRPCWTKFLSLLRGSPTVVVVHERATDVLVRRIESFRA